MSPRTYPDIKLLEVVAPTGVEPVYEVMADPLVARAVVLSGLCSKMRVKGEVSYHVTLEVKGKSVEIDLSTNRHYQSAKYAIARVLRVACVSTKTKHKCDVRAYPMRAFFGKATYVLRLLLEQGVVFRTGGHCLDRMCYFCLSGTPADLEPYWSKDRMFRATAMAIVRRYPPEINGNAILFVPNKITDTTRHGYGIISPLIISGSSDPLAEPTHSNTQRITSWLEFRDFIASVQAEVTKNIIKPFRRRWACGKMTFSDVLGLSNLAMVTQECVSLKPKWTWTGRYQAYHSNLMDIICKQGRKKVEQIFDSGEIYNLTDVHHNATRLVAGNLIKHVPRNYKELKRLSDVWHNEESSLRRAMRARENVDKWIFDELPEGLPPIGKVECRVIKIGEGYRLEGKEMGHCLGAYAGAEAFTCHLKRDDEEATLMVSKLKYQTQCFGKHNARNKLSLDVNAQWIPLLQEMVDKAEVKTAEIEAVKVEDVYDTTRTEPARVEENAERGRGPNNRFRARQQMRKRRAALRAKEKKRREGARRADDLVTADT